MSDEKKKDPQMEQENANPKGEKVGVYICYCGGNISDHVDVETVRERVAQQPGVAVARTNMFMCSDPGQELIMEDLKAGTVDRVVVASCAPSLHETTFRNTLIRAGMNPYIYDHANIREQVSWVHHGQSATDKATRLVSAAAAKATYLKPLEPIRVDAKRHATVIGGGIAGLRAAKDLADRGIEVTLIEKSPFLGGQLARLDRIAPTGEVAADLVAELAGQVIDDPKITILTCAEVVDFEGYVGNFKLGLKKTPHEFQDPQPGKLEDVTAGIAPGGYVPLCGLYPFETPQGAEELSINTGVIVLATGFQSYVPRSGEYGYKQFAPVITLKDLIRILAEAQPAGDRLRVRGREIRSMAMIHCVGSRQIPGIHPEDESGHLNEYCSRTCCAATLNAATTIRLTYPGTHVYEFYRDIRTYGRGQEELYNQAAKNRILFLRFEADDPPRVMENQGPGDYPLQVAVNDTLTFGEEVEVPADLVVLATGMEPSGIEELVEMMKLPVGMDRF
ncbi:MAG: FAD-dependent oxidoreductase, partial [Desulfobacterales bacterium]